MKKSKLTALALALALGFAPLGASAQRGPGPTPGFGGSGAAGVHVIGGCVISIMIAATDKGNKYKKELTTEEALTCGLLYWINEATKNR